LKAGWTSGVYQFFRDDVKEETDDTGRRFQFFKCAALGGCKHAKKGVVRFQTNADGTRAGDRSSTSNLKKHAIKCWGKDVVNGRLNNVDPKQRDSNIFAAFSRADQRPKRAAHRVHTEAELRAHLVRWVAESNRPIRIVEDREFREILAAGRPELNIHGRHTLARDLSAAYERCRAHVQSLLEEYPGRLSFTTDAWTSPNH
ncbi:hypothetical protein B0H14DRAFT_2306543, partial [Mycena olivaceomarginata]